jgi:hypothetical protein
VFFPPFCHCFQNIVLSAAVLAQASSPEVEVAVLQRLRNLIDQQRDQIRTRDKDLSAKSAEIDNVSKILFSHYSMNIEYQYCRNS